MPKLDGRQLNRTYRRKLGAETSEDDHCEYVFWYDGRAILRTELSTPFRDVSAGLVSTIARDELKLPRGARDLVDLVSCSFTEEQWQEHLKRLASETTRQT